MLSLSSYLSSIKTKTSEATLVVIGNEAADLDSMASSVTYAYLRTLQSPDSIILPVMPIARADFHLRTEAVYVFKEAGISADDLVFFDEVDFSSLMGDADLVLVDHNAPSASLEKFSNKVVGIIDHHVDSGMFTEANPRVIKTIGSNTSLVAMEYFSAGIEISQEVATLLYGTILLDTVNLDEKAGRVTDADVEVAAKLLPLCTLSQQEFFDRVQEEKFSVQGLSTNDLLRKDYKEWTIGETRLGIASALLPINQWAEMDSNLSVGFGDYTKGRSLNILLSMNAFTDPDFKRDLVIFCETKEAHDKLHAYLQANKLDLKPLEIASQSQGKFGYIAFYQQGNLGISRKKMHPLLDEYLG